MMAEKMILESGLQDLKRDKSKLQPKESITANLAQPTQCRDQRILCNLSRSTLQTTVGRRAIFLHRLRLRLRLPFTSTSHIIPVLVSATQLSAPVDTRKAR